MPRAWRLTAAVIVVAWHAVATYHYVPVWRSDLTLWAQAVVAAPGKARAHLNYAKALYLTADVAAMRREASIGARLSERVQR